MTDTGQHSFVLHTDGGSRGNPGPAAVGFVLSQEGAAIMTGGAYIGPTTNNVAEYEALIWGLENARALGAQHLRMIADSELMVKQVTGAYKIKNEALKALAARVMVLLRDLESWTFEHTLRAGNSEADALVNEALDERGEVGEPAIPYVATPLDLFAAHDTQKGTAPSSGSGLSRPEAETPSIATPAVEAARVTRSAVTPGIYSLTVKDHFDAAHSLYGYPGPCRELHGHTWDIEVTVAGRQLDDIGILYDFKQLKDDLHGILDAYDHHHVNEVPPFDTLSPTAENLARVIYDRLREVVGPQVTISEVAVWESPVARVAFRSDDAR